MRERGSETSLKLFWECTALTFGGSPGLVVMGGDSCTEGRGFQSQHLLLDGHFPHIFIVKIVIFA